MPSVMLQDLSCGRNDTNPGGFVIYFLFTLSTSIIQHRFYSNHVPWAILTACSFASALLLLLLRFMYATENKSRDTEQHDNTYDNVIVAITSVQGERTEKKVDKVCALPMSSG
jgi:hypothetical protein